MLNAFYHENSFLMKMLNIEHLTLFLKIQHFFQVKVNVCLKPWPLSCYSHTCEYFLNSASTGGEKKQRCNNMSLLSKGALWKIALLCSIIDCHVLYVAGPLNF